MKAEHSPTVEDGPLDLAIMYSIVCMLVVLFEVKLASYPQQYLVIIILFI